MLLRSSGAEEQRCREAYSLPSHGEISCVVSALRSPLPEPSCHRPQCRWSTDNTDNSVHLENHLKSGRNPIGNIGRNEQPRRLGVKEREQFRQPLTHTLIALSGRLVQKPLQVRQVLARGGKQSRGLNGLSC